MPIVLNAATEQHGVSCTTLHMCTDQRLSDLPVICSEVYVTCGLDGRHIYFRYNANSGDIVDNTIEQLDLENMGIAVEILGGVSWNWR